MAKGEAQRHKPPKKERNPLVEAAELEQRATRMLRMSKWFLAEALRLDAQAAVLRSEQ